MKKILSFLLFILLTTGNCFATLTAGNVPVTKVGGSTPQLQNSDLTDSVGVSAAFGVPLSITGALSATTLNIGSGTLYVSGGNVGIGTSSPNKELEINNTGIMRLATATETAGFDIGHLGGTGNPYVYLANNNANGGIELQTPSGNLIFDPNGDLYTNAWADYGVSGNVTGYSGTPTGYIYTKKVGKTVYVNYYITGTSNLTTTTFTLPYATASGSASYSMPSGRNADNGSNVTNSGLISIGSNSSTANLYKDMAGGAWTGSGTKTVQGQFWYQSV